MPISTTPRGHCHNTIPSRRETNRTAPEWRCSRCGKLLGVFQDERLHLRMVRGHEYFVSLPVTCTCRGCGGLNETPRPFGPRAA